MTSMFLTWLIVLGAIVGVLVRPFRWPEAVWAVAAALLLVVCGLMPMDAAVHAVGKGDDVYLFLLGMMLLAEVARREGLFDWLAASAVRHARGSPRRLFALVYLAATLVTVFLSNDATAVVLTPAVLAAAKKADTPALPLLFICAFVANAASFVLPISNPANLVLYGNQMPALGAWLARFALPSVLAIAATWFVLRWSQRAALGGGCRIDVPSVTLGVNGRLAFAAIGLVAVMLLVVSAFDIALGLPTALLGGLTAALVLLKERASPWPLLRRISWSVLPLVAGLFVLVEALERGGAVRMLASLLHDWAARSEGMTTAAAAAVVAVGSNLVNNLPAGLIASSALGKAQVPQRITDAVLIGVDLGPNLSITGSLATILWLQAIRRENENVGFLDFLKVGAWVMPPALILALAARMWMP